MTLGNLRRVPYGTAKALGDVQALTHKKPGRAIPKRVGRRLAGKLTGRLLASLFRPTR